MARPRRVSDEEVLQTVRETVLQEGPHVSLDRVAERLGVTSPALFRRFRSRKDLLIAALRPAEEPPYAAHLEAGPDERPIAEQLVDLLTRMGEAVCSALPCLSALRESGIAPDQLGWREPPPLRGMRALQGWLERAGARGLLRVDDAPTAAMTMMGAVQAPIFVRHMAKETSPYDAAGFARQLTALLLRGVAPEASARASQTRPKERS
jgi:AcrR family transcriptional regulator